MRLLSEQAARVVLAAEAVSPNARLVGGAGLALLLGHRHSDDLDLFSSDKEDVEAIVRAVEDSLRHEGSSATRVKAAPGFVRLEAPIDASVLRIDVAWDSAPLLDRTPVVVDGMRVESLRDQRANKLVTLLGRSELRDLVDLFFIERAGLPALGGLEEAVLKDGGMDPAWLAWAARQIEIKPLRGMVLPLDLDELQRFRDGLAGELLTRAGA